MSFARYRMSRFVETPVSTPNYIPKRLGTRTPLDVGDGRVVGSSLSPARPDERTRACLAPRIESLSNNRKIYIAHSRSTLIPFALSHSISLSLSLCLFLSISVSSMRTLTRTQKMHARSAAQATRRVWKERNPTIRRGPVGSQS